MEKSKNRTDLLAAGRKKLQQFRQKKDGKVGGSHGKKSKANPEIDPDRVDVNSAVQQSVDLDGGTVSAHLVDSESAPSSAFEETSPTVAHSLLEEGVVLVTKDDTVSHTSNIPIITSSTETHFELAQSATTEAKQDGKGAVHSETSAQNLDSQAQSSLEDMKYDGVVNQEADCSGLDRCDENANRSEGSDEDVTARIACLSPRHGNTERSDGFHVLGDSSSDKRQISCFKQEEPPGQNASYVENVENFQDSASGKDGISEGTETEEKTDAGVYNKPNATDFTVSPLQLCHGVEEGALDSLSKFQETPRKTCIGGGGSPIGDGFLGILEDMKQHLYLTNVSKDFLHFQLSAQSEEQMISEGRCQDLQYELRTLKALNKEIQDRSELISEELAHSKSETKKVTKQKRALEEQCLVAEAEVEELGRKASDLQSRLEKAEEEVSQALVANEELHFQLISSKGEIDVLNSGNCKLNSQLEKIEEEARNLRDEMADCKAALENSHIENANLTDAIFSRTEERNQIEKEKEFFACENKKLEAELLDSNRQLTAVLDKQLQLEAEIQETVARLEHLTEEKVYLSNSLDIHKLKVKEFEERYHDLFSEHGSRDNKMGSTNVLGVICDTQIDDPLLRIEESAKNASGTVLKSLDPNPIQGSSMHQELFDGSEQFSCLKEHLEDAEKMLYKLESAIQRIQSQSASLSRQVGKAGASGVSKLIQAFESKTQIDESGMEQGSSSEQQLPDSLQSTLDTEEVSGLRNILKQLGLRFDKLHEGFMEEKLHTRMAFEKLEAECRTQKEQKIYLQMTNGELLQKLAEGQVKIDSLQIRIDDIQGNAGDFARSMLCQVELLHKEIDEKTSLFDQERKSFIEAISEEVEKLDTSIRLFSVPSLPLSENFDVEAHLAMSIDLAIQAIQNLHSKLEAAYVDQEWACVSYRKLEQKFTEVNRRKEIASCLLVKVYGQLEEVLDMDISKDTEEGNMDVVAGERFETLFMELGKLLCEKKQFLQSKNGLMSDLESKNQEIEDLKQRCLHLGSKLEENEMKNTHLEIIMKLAENIKDIIQLDQWVEEAEKPFLVQLETLISTLLQKHREATEEIILSKNYLKEVSTRVAFPPEYWSKTLHTLLREELAAERTHLNDLQEKLSQSSASNLNKDEEILILKQSLQKMEEALELTSADLHAKANELEQSEQRLSSVREKLSIAVAKGKGLIVQRDNLKQSLADKCSEAEKCLSELQSKDAKLHEVEAKLKASEFGERVEALESELTYIRNSATALRESFLLKDSLLQRIEDVLEDLDLPEHFYSRDIIEKVEWLARSVTGNSVPLADWDQKSSVGGSYSDAGFVVMEKKENQLAGSNLLGLDDLRRKYADLESKFYSLAEHNEMLEQSLMERNNLIQKWEEVLDQIDVPQQVRSMEPEDRIEWLGRALAETLQERDSFQLMVHNLEISSESLAAESQQLEKEILDLRATLKSVTDEKELVARMLENLEFEHEELLEEATQSKVEVDCLNATLADLQGKLAEKHEKYSHIENEIKRLQALVNESLPVQDREDCGSYENSTDLLGGLVRKLVNNHIAFNQQEFVPVIMDKEPVLEEADTDLKEQKVKYASDVTKEELLTLQEELAAISGNLALVKVERDTVVNQYESIVSQVGGISKQRDELQNLLHQEEHKSASLREKLNVAVRKGKGLVQQRDSLKQTIEGMSADLTQLKHELTQKDRDFTTLLDKVQPLEYEILSLRNQVLHSEQEAQKSKRAAELLAVELNEVHERAEILQEDLVKANDEVTEALAARQKAVFNLEQFKKDQQATLMELVNAMDRLMNGVFAFGTHLAAKFSKDMEIFCWLEAGLESALKQMQSSVDAECNAIVPSTNLMFQVDVPSISTLSELMTENSSIRIDVFGALRIGLQECMKKIDELNQSMDRSFISFDQQTAKMRKIMDVIDRELVLRREAMESVKGQADRFESLAEERNTENSVLHRCIALLYDACTSSIVEIERKKLSENEMTLQLPPWIGGHKSGSDHAFSFSEDSVKILASTLSSAVKSLSSEFETNKQTELKMTILHLQREIQEKDIQNNQISSELISRIRVVEATANNYLADLLSAKEKAQRLEEELEVMKSEHDSLRARVDELKNGEAVLKELQERIQSLTEAITAKDQEIEALMQALDEEEAQMEGLTSRIDELEKTVQQKKMALETIEASRDKALSKLSTTLNKFNELHHLSESLLFEIENLETQLQGKDEEISFLRQEVTRCTKDLLDSQEINKINSSEVSEVLACLETMVSHFGVHDLHFDGQTGSRVHAYIEILEKNITSTVSRLDELKAAAQSGDILLQTERSKVEELLRNREALESSLCEKESQLELIQEGRDSGQFANIKTAEIMEVEPLINKRTISLGPATHVRSGRKVNDQVSVGVDIESGENSFLDEDDDKAHGFKSLATSRIVPRFTRPMADKIDGFWVSGERMLMREPTLRLGVVLYWILLHGLLAAYVV